MMDAVVCVPFGHNQDLAQTRVPAEGGVITDTSMCEE